MGREQDIVSLPEQQIEPNFWDRAQIIGGVAIASVALAIGGAFVGSQVPARAEIAPGLSVDASLQAHDTTIDLGALGSISLPEVHHHTPLGNIGAELTVHGVALDLNNPETLSSYAALKNDPKNSIQEPIIRAVERNTGIGAGSGLILGALAGTALLRRRRNQHTEQAQTDATNKTDESLQGLVAVTQDNPEATALIAELRTSLSRKPETSGTQKKRRLIAALVAGVLVMGAGGYTTINESTSEPTTPSVALNSMLTQSSPLLKGATITGNGVEWLVNTGTAQVANYIANTDAFYAKANANIIKAFAEKPALIPEQLNTSRYVDVMAVSDIHCNLAMLKKSLPLIAKLGQAQVIANMGDLNVSTGTLPSEEQCTNVMAKAVQPHGDSNPIIPIVSVQGNHDSKITADNQRKFTLMHADKPYHPFVVLDEQLPTAEVDGLTFTSGANDPRQSVMGHGTTPSDPIEQNKAVFRQGEIIAKNACAAKEKYNQAPIVLSHGMEAGYQSVVENCASIVMSGHLHVQKGPFTYKLPPAAPGDLNSREVFNFTQGSSSGAGTGEITEYSPVTAQAGAPYTFFIFDTHTNKPVGYYNLLIDTAAGVTLSDFTPMPAATDLPTKIPYYVATKGAQDDN